MVKRFVGQTRRPLRATVLRRERIGPHLARVTIGGPELAEFEVLGRDQWVRLFFPRQGQQQLRLPTWSGTKSLVQLLAMDRSVRPWVRSYTVRHARPDNRELDIDIVTHGTGSPGSNFGLTARPGDEVAVLDEGVTFLPSRPGRRLIVADDSATPAALSIIEGAAEEDRFLALLEVGESADIPDLRSSDRVDLRWLIRKDSAAVPGRSALDAVVGMTPEPATGYAWVAGESGFVTAVRRHLVTAWALPRTHISFVGYWKTGRASAG